MRRPDWLGSEEEGGTGRKGGSGRSGSNIMMDFIALLRNSVTEEKMEGAILARNNSCRSVWERQGVGTNASVP